MNEQGENIGKFEQAYGNIQDLEMPPIPPMNFSTPKAQAQEIIRVNQWSVFSGQWSVISVQ